MKLAYIFLLFYGFPIFAESELTINKFIVINCRIPKDADLAKILAEKLNNTKVSNTCNNLKTDLKTKKMSRMPGQMDPSNDKKLGDYCVDLRSRELEPSQEVTVKVKGKDQTVKLVKRQELTVSMNSCIDEATIEEIRPLICPNYGDQVGEVLYGNRIIPTAKLYMETLREDSKTEQIKKLSDKDLPALNKACTNGEKKEYESNAAGTDEAVKFLTEEKFNLHSTASLRLSDGDFPILNLGNVSAETRAKFPAPEVPTTIRTRIQSAESAAPTTIITTTVPLNCKGPNPDPKCPKQPSPDVIRVNTGTGSTQ